MKAFLIVILILAVIIFAVLSLSATLTLVYDNGWHTKVQVLFIEKDIVLSKILSFILFPERKAKEAAEKSENKKAENKNEKNVANAVVKAEEKSLDGNETPTEEKAEAQTGDNAEKPQKSQQKSNPIKQLWNNEGILGILDLLSNIVETANGAVITLIKGLHIYSLYVMIIVGGGDADLIGRAYGTLCKHYYPVKGLILNGMKVDNYDDYIQADFIADKTDFEFQLIASINIALILKVALKAGAIFVKNLISNKKSLKKGDKQI